METAEWGSRKGRDVLTQHKLHGVSETQNKHTVAGQPQSPSQSVQEPWMYSPRKWFLHLYYTVCRGLLSLMFWFFWLWLWCDHSSWKKISVTVATSTRSVLFAIYLFFFHWPPILFGNASRVSCFRTCTGVWTCSRTSSGRGRTWERKCCSGHWAESFPAKPPAKLLENVQASPSENTEN